MVAAEEVEVEEVEEVLRDVVLSGPTFKVLASSRVTAVSNYWATCFTALTTGRLTNTRPTSSGLPSTLVQSTGKAAISVLQ